MWKFLVPPVYKSEQVGPEADRRYKSLRLQVFIGAFVGYAAFYIVRKNFSMAIPMLEPFGFVKGELGTVLAMNAVAYALSKFLMGSVSDRSDARKFLPDCADYCTRSGKSYGSHHSYGCAQFSCGLV